ACNQRRFLWRALFWSSDQAGDAGFARQGKHQTVARDLHSPRVSGSQRRDLLSAGRLQRFHYVDGASGRARCSRRCRGEGARPATRAHLARLRWPRESLSESGGALDCAAKPGRERRGSVACADRWLYKPRESASLVASRANAMHQSIQTFYDRKYTEGTEIPRTSKLYAIECVSGVALEILDVGCGSGTNSRALAA